MTRRGRGAGGTGAVGSVESPPCGSVKSEPIQQGEKPRSQTIVLPDFPDPKLARQLSPNGRVHWATRAMAKKEAAHHIACACLLQGVIPPEGPVTLVFRWVFPTRGRHDVDNCIATAKPMIDALVEAGVLDDDDSRHVVAVTAEVAYERGRRALVVTIAPASGEGGE